MSECQLGEKEERTVRKKADDTKARLVSVGYVRRRGEGSER